MLNKLDLNYVLVQILTSHISKDRYKRCIWLIGFQYKYVVLFSADQVRLINNKTSKEQA